MRNLSRKQAGFVKDYVTTGNASLAARRNYDVSDDTTSRSIGSENLTKPHIREAVKEALMANNVTPDWIVGQHKELALKGQNETVKTRNLEDLGHIADIYPRRQNELEVDDGKLTISWTT